MRSFAGRFGLWGVSRAQCQGPQILTTAACELRKSGPAGACTFDTLIDTHSAKADTGFARERALP
jgi:hypothetical protein